MNKIHVRVWRGNCCLVRLVTTLYELVIKKGTLLSYFHDPGELSEILISVICDLLFFCL